jgi:hypothetical protein
MAESALALVLGLTALAVGQAGKAGPCVAPSARPRVTLAHASSLHARPALAVSGVAARRLEARLDHASDANGTASRWHELRRSGCTWRGAVPAPNAYGIYPVVLRAHPGGRTVTSTRWLLRLLPPGFSARPAFPTAEGAARWWVASHEHGALAALRRWPLPALDRRDPRLHHLIVVAWNMRGKPGIRDRRGMFVTLVRDGYRGRWRVLAATLMP